MRERYTPTAGMLRELRRARPGLASEDLPVRFACRARGLIGISGRLTRRGEHVLIQFSDRLTGGRHG